MQKNSRKQTVNKEAIERGINCPRENETFLFLWLISNKKQHTPLRPQHVHELFV